MPIEGTIRANAGAPAALPGAGTGTTQVVKFTDGGTAPAVQAPPTPVPAPAEGAAAGARPPEVESWRVAALAEKEKAIRETGERAKADRAAAETLRAQIEQEKQEFVRQQTFFRQNPMAALQAFGHDYDSLTRFVAQGGWSPEQQQQAILVQQQEQIRALAQQQQESVRQIEERLSKERSDNESAQANAQKQREEAAVTDFKNEIVGFVKAEGKAYEMIGLAGQPAVDQVFDEVRVHFEKTGERLSLKDAADRVEQGIIDEAMKVVAASEKIRARLGGGLPPARVAPPPGLGGHQGMPPPTSARPLQQQAQQGPETEAQRRQRVVKEIEEAWQRRRAPAGGGR